MTGKIHIDLNALGKATERLDEALRAYAATPDNLFVLDSVIKRFELSYLQTVRAMERFVRDYAPIGLESDASFRDFIESATDFGLTDVSFERWLDFRKARNKTAHTYLEDAVRALTIPAAEFLPVARFVLENVRRRVADDES